MNLLFLFFTGIAIGISGAMIPGPLTIFTISATLQTNKYAGLKIIFGHVILEFFFTAGVLFGLQRFTGSADFLRTSAIIGSIALSIMGLLLLLNAPKMRLSDIKGGPQFNKSLFIGGIIFSVISPGFLIWWATVVTPSIIKALLSGILGVIILTIGRWTADVGWHWSLSWGVSKGRMYLSDRAYQNVLRAFAVILILLSLRFYTQI
ncbi:LysE family translocator [Candidatus Omnitrophota bacterium]